MSKERPVSTAFSPEQLEKLKKVGEIMATFFKGNDNTLTYAMTGLFDNLTDPDDITKFHSVYFMEKIDTIQSEINYFYRNKKWRWE
jgi:hypothetical protein